MAALKTYFNFNRVRNALTPKSVRERQQQARQMMQQTSSRYKDIAEQLDARVNATIKTLRDSGKQMESVEAETENVDAMLRVLRDTENPAYDYYFGSISEYRELLVDLAVGTVRAERTKPESKECNSAMTELEQIGRYIATPLPLIFGRRKYLADLERTELRLWKLIRAVGTVQSQADTKATVFDDIATRLIAKVGRAVMEYHLLTISLGTAIGTSSSVSTQMH